MNRGNVTALKMVARVCLNKTTEETHAVDNRGLYERGRSALKSIASRFVAAATVPDRRGAAPAAVLDGPPEYRLRDLIAQGADLAPVEVATLVDSVEQRINADLTDYRLAIHRDIGRAIFDRSADLYGGYQLPESLKRFTYPAFLGVALHSHCNAACFFCRSGDYKGTSFDFENLPKLKTAIKNARRIDLTGWGEPFFYPRLEETVDYLLETNATTPHLIQITTNGSFLSSKWGERLHSRLGKMVISINAATADTYVGQMRYKNEKFTFENTLERIADFRSALSQVDRDQITMHMVANTDNFQEIPALVRLAHSLGIPMVTVGNYISAQPQYIDKTLWNVKDAYNSAFDEGLAVAAELNVTLHGRKFFGPSEMEIKGVDICFAPILLKNSPVVRGLYR